MDPILISLGICVLVIIAMCGVGAIVYGVLKTKITQESKTSLPQGTDSSEMGKFLQEKYKEERERGEFKRHF